MDLNTVTLFKNLFLSNADSDPTVLTYLGLDCQMVKFHASPLGVLPFPKWNFQVRKFHERLFLTRHIWLLPAAWMIESSTPVLRSLYSLTVKLLHSSLIGFNSLGMRFRKIFNAEWLESCFSVWLWRFFLSWGTCLPQLKGFFWTLACFLPFLPPTLQNFLWLPFCFWKAKRK